MRKHYAQQVHFIIDAQLFSIIISFCVPGSHEKRPFKCNGAYFFHIYLNGFRHDLEFLNFIFIIFSVYNGKHWYF